MKRRMVSAMTLMLLLTSMLMLAFHVQPVRAEGTIYIRADGSIYPLTATITTADNVTYTFADNIDSEIVVEKGSIVIDGKGYTLQGTGAYSSKGIHLSGIENVTVTKTNIIGFWYGIYIEHSNGNTVTENNITDNTSIFLGGFGNTIFRNNIRGGGSGIWLEGDANNISENNITGSACGMFFVWSSSNNVSRNSLTGNRFNFGVYAIGLSGFVNYVDASNTVDGKPVYYWINEHDKNVPSDAGYVALVNCTHISARNLSLAHNGQGLLLAYTTNSTIVENNITDTEYCIELFESTNNILSGNIMSGISSSVIGLSLSRSSYNKISGNSITNNGGGSGVMLAEASNNIVSGNIIKNSYGGVHLAYGIPLEPSSDNRFYNNSFIDNVQQVSVYGGSSHNAWDDGYLSGGNYWSDYWGVDSFSGPYQNETGSDGIGDTAYVIDASNQDNYPLMRLWVPFENQTIYIRADGSIDPSGAPIQRKGDLYVLTSNVTSDADGIVVERDNVILDGAGCTLQGTGNGTGLNLTGRSNVTITNVKIKAFDLGIWLAASSTNTIARNILAENHNGIGLDYTSNNNTILGNNVTGTDDGGILVAGNENVIIDNLVSNCVGVYGWGINVYVANNNAITKNKVMNNTCGLRLYHSRNNIIDNNEIADNSYGIYLEEDSGNNTIYYNNFINNTNQAHVESLTNAWDCGYPSGGNYWSDYNGTDLYSGPYQNETGNDGIGDAQYIIDSNNQDRYPLMNPCWNPADINHDLKVDVKDVYSCARAFGSLHGGLKWNPVYDMNDDGRIDLKDIWLICRDFGKTYP